MRGTDRGPGDQLHLDAGVVEGVQEHLFAFLHELRDAGLSVPVNKQLDFFSGITALAPSTTGQLYWVGVTTLVTGEVAQICYDEVFRQFFGSPKDAVVVQDEETDEDTPDDDEQPAAAEEERGDDDVLGDDPGGSGLRASVASPELPRRFAPTTLQQLAGMQRIRAELPVAVPLTRSRRRRSGRRRQLMDLRATCLATRRTHGEVVVLRWRHRRTRPRRVLLLIDVSGSMKQYSPDYLRFAHAAVASGDRVEAFTFGTRLTRITASLRTDDVDRALAASAAVVLDADGGTLIGESLQEFLHGPGCLTLARDALVIVLSDGLERGDCTAMTDAVRRLSQLSHRLVWWSPLACDPAYRPLTRGMAAVLGHLDVLTGVEDLTTALSAVRHHFSPTGSSNHLRRTRA